MLETIGNLARHKLRNGLTIGGIVIGILALTTMGAMAEKTNRLLEGGVAHLLRHHDRLCAPRARHRRSLGREHHVDGGRRAVPPIETRGLAKHYRRGPTLVRAVDGVDLRIERGEFVAVVGRSGSGKTTLLDCLGLLLTPSSGQVPGLTALENVMLPLRYAGRNRDGRGRARALLAEVGLAERARHRPGELSGGEQQRVAIARSLVNDPAIVLADEPTGELDTDTAEELVALMRRVNRERGATFVVVTHDADLAAHADRVIRLQDGRVASEERRA